MKQTKGPADHAAPLPEYSSTTVTAPDAVMMLKSTTEVAFASDESRRVIGWNRAAGRFFGRKDSCVVGKRCFEAISARDIFGNRFCSETCAVWCTLRHGESLHPYLVQLTNSANETVTARCRVITAFGPQPGRRLLIHLIRPTTDVTATHDNAVGRNPVVENAPAFLRKIDARSVLPPRGSLTGREIEVLRLLGDGRRLGEIAGSLFISETTVRNHIQHILAKLRVHNRLQAVIVAQRDNLI